MTSATNTTSIQPDTHLLDVPGVGKQTAEKFQKIGVQTVSDLFELLPHRHEDRSVVTPITELQPGVETVISGVITSIHSRLSNRGVFLIQARVEDTSGAILAVWFNQRYLLKSLQVGQPVLLYGTKKIIPPMKNPFFVKKQIPRLEIVGVYPSTEGLTQYAITKTLQAVQSALDHIESLIPSKFLKTTKLGHKSKILREAHFSPSNNTLQKAVEILGFEELFLICIQALYAKSERNRGSAPVIDTNYLNTFIEYLPFTLTEGQKEAVTAVCNDLQRNVPMNRLLYGEVGSGKTAVAMLASALCIRSKKTVVWLSPTTALADQQFQLLQSSPPEFSFNPALIMGNRKSSTHESTIYVGTHALLNTNFPTDDIGLIIIDEQHRFGVEQRNQLSKRHPNAHVLMMSATPIPRSLAHSLFGYIDFTFMQGKPLHQKPVETKLFMERSRKEVENEIAKRISIGQPGYVICPLIYDSHTSSETLFLHERKSITSELTRLRSVFPNAKIGVLHGKLKAAEKEKILMNFKNRSIDILLSTSVVEVGIDNPHATWIMIEEADRFGLSQLHQLRGRVGRGVESSICFLNNSLNTDRSTDRLSVLLDTNSGLVIAEKDLQLRGPGNLAGIEQSGLPLVKYANLTNLEDVKKAYTLAEMVMKEGLENYPRLSDTIKKNFTNTAITL